MRKNILMTLILSAAIFVGSTGAAWAVLSEPDVVYYGTANNASPGSTVTIMLNGSTSHVASFTLGADLRYILRVAMDAFEPRTPGTALTGDAAAIFINGILAAKTSILSRGTLTNLDLGMQNAEQWAKDHPGDKGAGDMNRNGITDLAEYMDGKDPARCVWNQVDASHAETTVYHPQVLGKCLADAGSDGKHNVIRVARGSYAGNFSYSSAWGEAYDLTLIGGYDPAGTAERSADPSLTVLSGDTDDDGTGNGIVLSIDDTSKTFGKIHIEGLTIRNGHASSGQNGGGIQASIYQGTLELVGNIITNNTADIGGGLSIESNNSGEVFLTNNVISNNSAANAAAIRIVTAATGTVILLNNTIADNIASAAGDGRSVLIKSTIAPVDMTNNIVMSVAGVTGKDIFINSVGVAIPLSILNNDVDAVSGLLVNAPGFIADASNISVAPLFAAPLTGNYHISSASPCIDKGAVHAKQLTKDADGAGRVSGNAVDLGAYEVNAFTTNPATAVGATSATLNGMVNANNTATTISFEYGTTTTYGSSVAAIPALVSDASYTSVTAEITGLTPGTVYHYRVKGVSVGQTLYGMDQIFTTHLDLAFTSSAAVSFTYNTAGSFTVTANGFPVPTFSTGSALPIGITLNKNGALGGTPTATGSFPVVITAGNSVGTLDQNVTIVVNKATASIMLSNLTHTFDGLPKAAVATTNPLDKAVILTYNGSTVVPTYYGSYVVVGTINDANYQGTATGTLVIKGSDTIAPTLNVSTLVDGASTNNPTVNVAGMANDSGSGIKSVTINNQIVAVHNDGSFSVPITLADGPNMVTTTASDSANNQTTDTRTISLDRTAPGVMITRPADNSVTHNSFIDIIGSVVDPAVIVTGRINGDPAILSTMSGTNFNVTLNLAAGLNTITITGTAPSGKSSSVKRTIFSNSTAMTLAVIDPAQDFVTTKDSITLHGAVSDIVTSATISMLVDGLATAPTVSADGGFSQNISLPMGKTYAVVITATDLAGNTATVKRNVIKTAPGDINGDGKVDVGDVLRVLRIILGMEAATADDYAKADVAPMINGKPAPDGVIDIGDAVVILNMAVGL